MAASRNYLRQLDLTVFVEPTNERFLKHLDTATIGLLSSLPRGARHWGLARKVMNIFLRDCLYTTYLDAALGLRRNEASFELPLDSITANQLKRAVGRGKLPAWPGVKHLTDALSAKFQDAASDEATRRGIPRIHLDAIWWSLSRDDDAI